MDDLLGLYIVEIPYPKDFEYFCEIQEWMQENAIEDYKLPFNVAVFTTYLDDICYNWRYSKVLDQKWHVAFTDEKIAIWFKLTWQ
jgi:hypothetical protein